MTPRRSEPSPKVIELTLVHTERLHRVERNGSGASRARGDHRELTEELSGPQNSQGRDVSERRRDPHRDMALVEDVQGVAGIALVEEHLTLGESPAPGERQKLPTVALGELGENPGLHAATFYSMSARSSASRCERELPVVKATSNVSSPSVARREVTLASRSSASSR
jgi:hypothetical protein